MSTRFHNKFHRHNHHTAPTDRQGLYPDSAYDPIASLESPFKGNFYSDNSILTNESLSAHDTLYASYAFIHQNAIIANTLDVSGTATFWSDFYVKGDAEFEQDVRILGNLTVDGDFTQLDTIVTTTSSVSVLNTGTAPALWVKQYGNNFPVAEFYDENKIALYIGGHENNPGHVGIGTSSPNVRLTVHGSISGHHTYVALNSSYALGEASFAANTSTASQKCSFAAGKNTLAGAENSTSFGNRTKALGINSFAIGSLSITGPKASIIDNTLNSSFAEGHATAAVGPVSHAEGYRTSTGTKVFISSYDKNNRQFTFSPQQSSLLSYVASGRTLVGFSPLSSFTIIVEERNPVTGTIIAQTGTDPSFTSVSGEEAGITLSAYFITDNGSYSHAEGYFSEASGDLSHAEGSYTKASGRSSHAEGSFTIASGEYSHAEGSDTIASGNYSHAEGRQTKSSGAYSHTEGYFSQALGSFSHAEGNSTTATGDYSHTEGSHSVALSAYSHAEGQNTTTSGVASHAEGTDTEASGSASHAEGKETIASGDYSHAEGVSTQAIGIASHAEGETSQAIGIASHAENNSTAEADYSHSEGNFTQARAESSHAEGEFSIASGKFSHAEGRNSEASGESSHAEGAYTTASGTESHAEGFTTTASGSASHSEGYYTKAFGNYSHAAGIYATAAYDNSYIWSGDSTVTASISTTKIGQYLINAPGDLYLAQGKFGLYTDNPQSSLHVSATDAIIIPVGDTSQRVAVQGAIRYNSELSAFEGYGTNVWGTLGGVRDTDQDTYIIAEDSPGSDNDQIKFFVQGQQTAIIDTNGNVGIGTPSPNEMLTVTGNISTQGLIYSKELDFSSLERPSLTGIKEALDTFLYTPLSMSYVRIDNVGTRVLEVGQSYSTPTITWLSNKPEPRAITQFELTLPNGEVSTGDHTYTSYNDTNTYNVDLVPNSLTQSLSTWTVKATDWKNAISSGTASIYWRYKMFFGVTTSSTLSSAEVLSDSIHNGLVTSRTGLGTKTVSPNGEYFFVAYPKRFGATSMMTVNNFNYNDFTQSEILFTNSFNATTEYYVYRSNNLLYSTYNIAIQ